MNFCTVQKAGIYDGCRWLFRELSFGLQAGDRLAVVARNGRGKSSLLRMLAGEQPADEGNITFRTGVQRVYLPQHVAAEAHTTVMNAALSFLHGDAAWLRAYHQALSQAISEK